MTTPKTFTYRFRRAATFVLAFAAGVWVCDRWMSSRVVAAEPSTEPIAVSPATMPATTQAATRPVLPADVAKIAARVRDVYTNHPLRVKATLTADFDVAGLAEHDSHAITAALASPTQFRHESSVELVLAGDGTAITTLDVAHNAYAKQTIPDGQATPTLDEDVQAILLQQNPALLVAISGDADAVFLPAADASVRILPAKDDAAAAKEDVVETTLADGTIVRTTVDRTRGAIDSVDWDFAPLLRQHGAPDVKQASAKLHYDQTTVGGDAPAQEQLAFRLPSGAREAVGGEAGHMLDGLGGDPSAALVGKAAPAIALPNVAGQTVHAVGPGAPQNDVVVLDFFATWCGPCRMELPRVAEVAKRFAPQGVRVFVVDKEDADTVRRFFADQQLEHVTPLVDAEGTASDEYFVSGIPQTVVIGRDRKVRKVFVGFDPNDANALDDAVENALK